MDAFLFQTRAGFCEHYASAFVVLMRAAGVPARVVAGYQGGEVNPVNRTVIVHQFDAHAWAEVWLEGKGWVRVDPTAAVSPDRIEWGLERAMAAEGGFLSDSPLSLVRYRSIAWLNTAAPALRCAHLALAELGDGLQSRPAISALERRPGGHQRAQVHVAIVRQLGAGTGTCGDLAVPQARYAGEASLDLYYLQFCERMAAVGFVRAPGRPACRICCERLRLSAVPRSPGTRSVAN